MCPPTAHLIEPGDVDAIVAVVLAEFDVLGEGRLAVIAPATQVGGLQRALASALPAGAVASGSGALDAPIGVLAVSQAKGLEFDSVRAGRASPHSRGVCSGCERPLRRADPPNSAASSRPQ